RIRARSEASLEQGHQETDGTSAWVLAFCGCTSALSLHESRNFAIQLELRTVDLKIDCVWNSLRENRLGRPLSIGPSLREVDHRFLRSTEVERRAPTVHRFTNRPHVGICIGIKQLQEEAEVFRVATVRRRSQQQQMVRRVTQQLSQLVTKTLVR